jgi:hypothetical protein
MKTARERAEEQRRAKLALMRKQVEAGKLVIRQMTPAEREKYPARPVKAKRAGSRRPN